MFTSYGHENSDPYQSAQAAVESFLNNEILEYDKLRNFDFGKNNHRAVSQLSPFVSHGILNEFDLIKKVLERHPYSKVEKFVQEVFWRVYWKGWLEHRPTVYDDFVAFDGHRCPNYDVAISGKTGISCFDDWVDELKSHNYLHNHARMWFASIWIFTLKLPWQLGAKFFLEHLFDGDAASNTLSWRWVAGLQTKGKNYLARSSNINKYTSGRYVDVSLCESASPLFEKQVYEIEELKYPKESVSKNNQLLVCDTQLLSHSEFIEPKRYDEILVVTLNNEDRLIKLSKQVLDLKKRFVESFCSRTANASIYNGQSLRIKISKTKNIDVLYPSVGENFDFLSKLARSNDLNINYLVRNFDRFCWNFSKKGFFNFKKNIPMIIDKLNFVG